MTRDEKLPLKQAEVSIQRFQDVAVGYLLYLLKSGTNSLTLIGAPPSEPTEKPSQQYRKKPGARRLAKNQKGGTQCYEGH